LPFQAKSIDDKDQNSMQKSWLTQQDLSRMQEAMKTIYRITS